jgi:hypothetical protein
LGNIIQQSETIDQNSFNALKGSLLQIITNQNGSRAFQKALRNTDKSIISQIFTEIKGNFCNLLTDSYANYFVQKFFNFLNETERIEFIKEMKDSIVEIGNNKIGTYPLQAILEQLCTSTEREMAVEYICNGALALCQVT